MTVRLVLLCCTGVAEALMIFDLTVSDGHMLTYQADPCCVNRYGGESQGGFCQNRGAVGGPLRAPPLL